VYENLPDSSSDALQPRTHCCGPTAHVYIKSGTIGELTHCMVCLLDSWQRENMSYHMFVQTFKA